MPATITVLGAGSWGTALAVHLSRVGHDVRLWARDPTIVDDMRARRANVVYLADVTLPACAPRAICSTISAKEDQPVATPGATPGRNG